MTSTSDSPAQRVGDERCRGPAGAPVSGRPGAAALPATAVAARRLRSHAELTRVLARLDRSTHHELLEMIPSAAGVAVALQTCRDDDLETLRRGIACRLVVERSCAELPNLSREIECRQAAGAQVRVVERSSSWFRLFDRAAAVLPRSAEPAPTHALVVHEDTVVGSLYALFARTWGQSSEFHDADGSAHFRERDRHVLEHLGRGTTDEVAARRMDVSVRTYRRYVADVMDRLGAASRFQAGALAAGRGWL